MEKTFYELIKDFSIYNIWWANAPSPQKIDKNFEAELINFGKKVRKATIAECEKIAIQGTFSFKSLPTDRIKTEK